MMITENCLHRQICFLILRKIEISNLIVTTAAESCINLCLWRKIGHPQFCKCAMPKKLYTKEWPAVFWPAIKLLLGWWRYHFFLHRSITPGPQTERPAVQQMCTDPSGPSQAAASILRHVGLFTGLAGTVRQHTLLHPWPPPSLSFTSIIILNVE